MGKHLILFAATTGYQIRTFAAAARRLGLDLTLATDRCHQMEDPWEDHALAVKFDHRMPQSLELLRGLRCDGVAAIGDRPAVLAAEAAHMLGVPFHSPVAARASHDKFLARQLFQPAGLRLPSFFRATLEDDPQVLAARAQYPCVLKPLGLSGSRGVIRADNPEAFLAAYARIRKIGEKFLQVESYIPGREFAVEGLVTHGQFRALALFDKPDPLEGPYFEESIYVTPSREATDVQREILDTVARACQALGLCHGPVHAEVRHNSQGAWILEAHARPIGGLCAQAVRMKGGMPLEELILRHATGEDVAGVEREAVASGVMMIPIPRDGMYESVEGIENARAVPGIEDVVITAKVGQRLVPLPEGSSYLGFIIGRGETPGDVERALRQSHAALGFHIATALETFSPSA